MLHKDMFLDQFASFNTVRELYEKASEHLTSEEFVKNHYIFIINKRDSSLIFPYDYLDWLDNINNIKGKYYKSKYRAFTLQYVDKVLRDFCDIYCYAKRNWGEDGEYRGFGAEINYPEYSEFHEGFDKYEQALDYALYYVLKNM